GDNSLESANLDWDDVTPSDIHDNLYNGTLVSFNMVSADGETLCSFVSTWDDPMKSQWIVETPDSTPVDNTPDAENPCDNGWQGSLSLCAAQEEQRLADAEGSIPPQDTSDPRDVVDDYIVPP